MESDTVTIPISFNDGPTLTGTYTTYFLRDAVESHNQYIVTTNADEVINLSPSVLDLTEFPKVKRLSSYTSNIGTLEFVNNGAKFRRTYNIGNAGTNVDLTYTNSVLPGTVLQLFHNRVITAASAAGKDELFYRSKITGLPIEITNGSMYLNVEPNPNCWASQWDLTGVPLWLSAGSAPGGGGGPNHGGVPITSRHFVEAEHYPSPVGTEWKWMLANGTIVSRTSIGVNSRPTGANQAETQWLNEIPGDIRVHTLNAPLPAGVKIYPIVGPWGRIHRTTGSPSTEYPWQTTVSSYCPLVGLYLDQKRRAWFLGSYSNDTEGTDYSVAQISWNGNPISLNYAHAGLGAGGVEGGLKTVLDATGRYRAGISGDSGSALLIPLNSTDLAVLTCLTVPASGPSYEEQRMNLLIASADADAILRGNISTPTNLTVSVAPAPF
jgi:hypothetical protein